MGIGGRGLASADARFTCTIPALVKGVGLPLMMTVVMMMTMTMMTMLMMNSTPCQCRLSRGRAVRRAHCRHRRTSTSALSPRDRPPAPRT